MMFISKFNALIRNRIVWGVIAFIVVMAFVVWGTQTGGSRVEAEANKVGMLDGKQVPPEEFRQAYFNAYLSMSLAFGRRLNVSGKIDTALRKMAWKRLIALRTAEAMNVPVTSDEVIAAVREQPYFKVDGQFSPERYQAFMQGILANLGATEPQFEEFIRQEITLNKLRRVLAQAVWISPLDINQIFHQLYDIFAVSYVCLIQEELAHMVKVTDEDGRIFFEVNREQFTVPQKASVKYVTFPIEKFVNEESVDDDLLLNYYDEHIEDYAASGTGEWDAVQPFDEVKDEIRKAVAREEAATRAGETASTFEVMLAPDRSGHAPTFEEAAVTMGLSISTSALFSIQEEIAGLDVGLEFNKAAFGLRPTPEESFSYCIEGKKAFYVLGYHERRDSRIPEFEEVKETVMLAAMEQAVRDKLKELASDIHEAVGEAIRNGASFPDAVAPFGLEVLTTEPFTVTSRLMEYDDSDTSYMLMKHVLSCNADELTDIIPLENGFLIGHVDARVPADRATYDAIRNDLNQYVKQKREETVFNEWQSYLLASARFQDLTPVKPAAAEEENAENESEEME